MTDIPPTVPPSTPPPGGSYVPPPPPPPPAGGSAGGDRTVMIVLSYLGILCLIPLLTKKDDPEVQWHAKNGLALMIADIAVFIVLFIVQIVLSRIVFAGCGFSVISCVVWIGILVLHVLCIIKGVNGQRFRIPVVTDFAEKM